MTIRFKGIECNDVWEAMQQADIEGGKPIRLAGRYFVVVEQEAERLAADGVSFAFLSVHTLRDGTYRLVTVPVN